MEITGVAFARGSSRVSGSEDSAPKPARPGPQEASSGLLPQDEVELSDEALRRSSTVEESESPDAPNDDAETPALGEDDLTPEEKDEVKQLRERDAEVRRHEEAHASRGGQYAGSPTYEYERGPDGKRYAVAGQVQIDVTPIPGDPDATIRKMTQVRAAALAPAEPSDADRAVASDAQQKIAEAKIEKGKQTAEQADHRRENKDAKTSGDTASPTANPAYARGVASYQRAAAPSPGPGELRDVA